MLHPPKSLISRCLIALILLSLLALGWLIMTQGPGHKGVPPLGPHTWAVVEITGTGFIPSTLSINPNTTVIWVNEDTLPHLPAADPYPTHSDLPSLVAPKALGTKETYSYLFTVKGRVGYMDELEPTWTGTVEVR